jgi:hypothetical protein
VYVEGRGKLGVGEGMEKVGENEPGRKEPGIGSLEAEVAEAGVAKRSMVLIKVDSLRIRGLDLMGVVSSERSGDDSDDSNAYGGGAS